MKPGVRGVRWVWVAGLGWLGACGADPMFPSAGGSTAGDGGPPATTTATTTGTASGATGPTTTEGAGFDATAGTLPTTVGSSSPQSTTSAGDTTGSSVATQGSTGGGGDPTGDPVTPANPSPGCALAAGVPGDPNAVAPSTLLLLPPGYDGTTPVPLLFAFHGAGRTEANMRNVDSRTEGTDLEANYAMAFVKSNGNAWDLQADSPRLDAVYTALTEQLCVDLDRVFAMGHSSGAQFIVQRLGAGEDRFAAVAPVASSDYGGTWSPLPSLVIHGQNDNQRGNDGAGFIDLAQYTDANACGEDSAPQNFPGCQSLAGGMVDPGCVSFQGCAADTVWCQHDDPNYIDNGVPTNHGWPCFANDLIFEFFESH